MRLAALLACLLLGLSPAHAADVWPSRPIRLIVAQAPGGPPDLIARFVAEPLSVALGVPVVVDNRAGASGIVGVSAAAQAAPDGYTLVIGTLSTHVLVPHVTARPSYDPQRDFEPVANLFRSIKVLWVPATGPARSLGAWFEHVSAHPGALNYGSGGAGSSNHIDMALVLASAGLDMTHIPYNGPSAAISAVAGGDVQAMIVSIGTGLPLLQGGRIRAMAVFSDRRSPLLPDVPTAAEQGFTAVDLGAWIGLLAPARTPAPIVARLNGELNRILRSQAALDWAQRNGLEIIGGSPAMFGATLAADYRRWGDVVRRLQLPAN